MAMRRFHLRPGRRERDLTRKVSRTTPLAMMRMAKAVAVACDARVLLTVGAAWLLADHRRQRSRTSALRFAATISVTTVLHHAIKRVIAERRPDRSIPNRLGKKTGRPFDAMPSGHAMHAGALASYVTSEFGGGLAAWMAAGALAAARVLTLAHWPSGVFVGFLSGVISERGVRLALNRLADRSTAPTTAPCVAAYLSCNPGPDPEP
jgi:membrane-associated phospholipid phosphatase